MWMEGGPPDPGCVPMPATKACITPCNNSKGRPAWQEITNYETQFLATRVCSVWGAFYKTECPLARSSYFGRCWPADWPPYGHWFDSNVGRPCSTGLVPRSSNNQFAQHIHIIIAICHPIYFLPLWFRLNGKVWQDQGSRIQMLGGGLKTQAFHPHV
jgi:hypothetical protein